MKISEVIGNTVQVQPVKPTAVAQQERINKVVAQRTASETQLQPTATEKALAMMQHAELKKQADAQYAANTKKQAVAASSVVQPKKLIRRA